MHERFLLWLSFTTLLPCLASAQVFEVGTSLVTTANASVLPGLCNQSDGGAGSSEATISCSGAGLASAGSAATSLASSTSGGSTAAFALASASSPGGSSGLTATGQANSVGTVTWQMLSDTHYSLRTTSAGAGVARLEGPGPLPPSGILSAGFYTLRAQGTALASAPDTVATSAVSGPHSATADVTFAEVGSPTLILGTVTADGEGAPGLLVEAIEDGVVIAAATTGDDGTYILPNLPGTVILRVSDPEGILGTAVSGNLAPPTSFDVELLVAVPALPAPFAVALGLALVLCARARVRR